MIFILYMQNTDDSEFSGLVNSPVIQLQHQETNHDLPSTGKKGNSLIIGYEYFIQGLVLGLPGTVILTYSKLPEYSVMSLFSLVNISFAFKFLTAPFIETYTRVNYGKRKTWIVLASAIISVIVFYLSFFTQEKYQIFMALSFIVAVFFISLQDIALDALGLKELRDPARVSYLQSVMQEIGVVFGSMVFMKLLSPQFASLLGLSKPILTTGQFFRICSVGILTINIWIHFRYREQVLQSEIENDQVSLLQNIKEYRIFFKLQSRYCRQSLFFILYKFGSKFFLSGISIELMKSGFSKQRLNQINNVSFIPALIIIYLMSKRVNRENVFSDLLKLNIVKLTTIVLIYIIWPISYFGVFLTSILLDMLGMMETFINATIVNLFPVCGLSGMFVTMLYSAHNLGGNVTIQLLVISKIGFNAAAILGFVIQFFILIFFKNCTKWIEGGNLYETHQKNEEISPDELVEIHS